MKQLSVRYFRGGKRMEWYNSKEKLPDNYACLIECMNLIHMLWRRIQKS